MVNTEGPQSKGCAELITHTEKTIGLSGILQAVLQQAVNLKSSMGGVFIPGKLAHGINQSFFYLPRADFQHFSASLWSETLFV